MARIARVCALQTWWGSDGSGRHGSELDAPLHLDGVGGGVGQGGVKWGVWIEVFWSWR